MVNIFIVEDDNSLRMLYEKALALNGYNILGSARDGQEAVQKYEAFKEKPDIIIMDHRMPIKNGIEATKEILNNSSEIKPKVIFASADNSIKEMALQIGVKSFKSKPFTLQRLFDNIKKVLIMD
ncbi:MAG: response regulator [Promethearchaeota archaeon]|nr:MAG: response regulator [Candidatus Lokiarchaeota archaeon]